MRLVAPHLLLREPLAAARAVAAVDVLAHVLVDMLVHALADLVAELPATLAMRTVPRAPARATVVEIVVVGHGAVTAPPRRGPARSRRRGPCGCESAGHHRASCAAARCGRRPRAPRLTRRRGPRARAAPSAARPCRRGAAARSAGRSRAR